MRKVVYNNDRKIEEKTELTKNYLKDLQRKMQKQNNKNKNARSVLTQVDAGNVPYNISVFNSMNGSSDGAVFSSDGASFGADSTIGGMGEQLNVAEALEALNNIEDEEIKYDNKICRCYL